MGTKRGRRSCMDVRRGPDSPGLGFTVDGPDERSAARGAMLMRPPSMFVVRRRWVMVSSVRMRAARRPRPFANHAAKETAHLGLAMRPRFGSQDLPKIAAYGWLEVQGPAVSAARTASREVVCQSHCTGRPAVCERVSWRHGDIQGTVGQSGHTVAGAPGHGVLASSLPVAIACRGCTVGFTWAMGGIVCAR